MSAPSSPPSPAGVANEARSGSATRRWILLLAKVVVVVAAFAYVLSRQPLAELGSALERITPAAVASAVGLQFLCYFMATFRWRSLLIAYGAEDLPPIRTLFRVYLIGAFYNTYLPGAVGGDVVRGVATRRSLRDGGATASVAIVVVERALGLLAILIAAALAAPLDPRGQLAGSVLPYALLGMLCVALLIVAIAKGRRLARHLPPRVAKLLMRLPVLSRPAPFLAAIAISLGIQFFAVTCGHVIVASIYPAVRPSDSLLVIPLASAAAFFPLSIAGAGPRDAVLVTLYALAGVPRAAAVAAALALLMVTLLVAASGGILQLLAPLESAQDRRS